MIIYPPKTIIPPNKKLIFLNRLRLHLLVLLVKGAKPEVSFVVEHIAAVRARVDGRGKLSLKSVRLSLLVHSYRAGVQLSQPQGSKGRQH